MSKRASRVQGRAPAQGGFSLVELMIAMVVTLMVSGAIYGLIVSGQSAFVREPELADRQQNIRAAMDMITRDVVAAGTGMPMVPQVFTDNDPGGGALNGQGPAGTLGAAAAAARNADPNSNSDVLELLSADERCPALTQCGAAPAPTTADVFFTNEPSCASPTGIALLTDNVRIAVQPVNPAPPPAPNCAGGDPAFNGSINLFGAVAPWNTPGGWIPPVYIYSGRVARYQIGPDPNDLVNPPMPVLWRSETGRYGSNGALQLAPGAAGFPGPNNTWQIVARGIEDLQVEYQDARTGWRNTPDYSVVPFDPTVLVRQVRVTLSARVGVSRLHGMRQAGDPAAGPVAVRGQLVNTVMPRAAYVHLQLETTTWR